MQNEKKKHCAQAALISNTLVCNILKRLFCYLINRKIRVVSWNPQPIKIVFLSLLNQMLVVSLLSWPDRGGHCDKSTLDRLPRTKFKVV